MSDLVPNPPVTKRKMTKSKAAQQDLMIEFRRLALRIGLEQAETILRDIKSKLL